MGKSLMVTLQTVTLLILGAPQSSVLGPILFLIFINDLPDSIISKLAIYSDDTTLYSSLGKTNDVS